MAKKVEPESAADEFRGDLQALVQSYDGKLTETEMRRIMDRVLNGLRG